MLYLYTISKYKSIYRVYTPFYISIYAHIVLIVFTFFSLLLDAVFRNIELYKAEYSVSLESLFITKWMSWFSQCFKDKWSSHTYLLQTSKSLLPTPSTFKVFAFRSYLNSFLFTAVGTYLHVIKAILHLVFLHNYYVLYCTQMLYFSTL